MDPKTLLPIAIGVLAFASIAMVIMASVQFLGGGRSQARGRLDRYNSNEDGAAANDEAPALRDRRLSRFDTLNGYLRESGMAQGMALQLAQARVPLRVGEYLMIRLLTGIITGYLLSALGGNVLAVVPGVALGYFIPHFYVSQKKGQRVKLLETQLVDALSLSANSLRAGWGFTQAMAQIASEMPPPVSEEFTQVLQEISIGATPEEAINSMIKRVGSYDVELVMTGVLIQRQIGGNLAEMMDNAVHTIRERIRLLGDIASIVAESRMSMWLLSALPILLLSFMALTMPDYTLPFLNDPRGRLMLVAAGVMEVLGVLVMRRLSTVEV